MSKTTADCKHCTKSCPFLEVNYFEALQKIPYYCDLFETFLGFDGDVLRCSECLGQQRSIKEEGLNFINAFCDKSVNRSVTKMCFVKLLPNLQNQFVAFLKKFGKPVGVPTYMDIYEQLNIEKIQKTLIEQLEHSRQEIKNEPRETEELKAILRKQTDSFPEALDSKVCKLILSLFAVLDVSERQMLLQILRNPHSLAVFLQKLKFMPKDKSLLGSVRLEIRKLLPEAQIENESIDNAKAIVQVQALNQEKIKS